MSLRLSGVPLPVVGRARIYVCGITPYDTTHVGHAAAFVWTDVVARVLHRLGAEVEVCRNITDVDDDMLEQARKQGVDWRSLAARQTYRFEEDMRLLGIEKPTFEPTSHNYVDEVIALATGLIELGFAYVWDGSVFFRDSGVAEAAGLDRRQAEELVAERGGHVAARLDRDDPLDPPVWQRSLPGEPSWPSPWGEGRPGWHAECTAMALATLGSGIDVHAGGADLAFPHHAYEAAQAERLTGVVPFARAWLHVGTVNVDGKKMAKSEGNLVFVHDLLEDWPPEAIRLLLLDRRWDEPWDYDAKALAAAADRTDRLRSRAGSHDKSDVAERAALDALCDDLDVPRALAIAEETGGGTLRSIGRLLGVI